MSNQRPDYEPTSDEIARRAAAIRDEWTPEEEAKRAGVSRDAGMTVPIGRLQLREGIR